MHLSFRFQSEIYPTVGLQTPHEAIEANFGLSPFKFDIEKYMDVSRDAAIDPHEPFLLGLSREDASSHR